MQHQPLYCQHIKLCKGQNSKLAGVSSLALSSALRCASTCVNDRQPNRQPSNNIITVASAS